MRAGMPAQWPGPTGAVNADGRIVTVAGLRIAGLGGSIRYNTGPNQWSERQQSRRARSLTWRNAWQSRLPGSRRGVDVLLTHSPARGVGDAEDRPHRGFECFTPLIHNLDPTVMVHGHIHPHGRTPLDLEVGRTIVLNTVGFTLMEISPGTPADDREAPTWLVTPDFPQPTRRTTSLVSVDVPTLPVWSVGYDANPDDVNAILPFDEVVAALGKVGEKSLGLQVVTIESIVGSVDRTGDFDRYFRPTSTHSRARWERLAVAQRRGESVPPVQLYRVGSMHFVIDGHHRVSIACAMHQKTIDAYVTEIITRISPEGITQRADLPHQGPSPTLPHSRSAAGFTTRSCPGHRPVGVRRTQ